jgi:SAM-dependent methyltransferase
VAGDNRWNHNIHYHAEILRALPPACGHVLDVGCGEGMLARDLAVMSAHVTAIDRDPATLELARNDAAAPNIEYVLGDFLTYPFEDGAFDAVVSIATIHHVGSTVALERMRELVRPGGTIAVIGIARSESPVDVAYDSAGFFATRYHSHRKEHWETAAPKVWPPPESYADARRVAKETLPGVRYRRHILFRYSLVWTKPGAS